MRDVRWGPRTLDLDLIIYGEEIVDTESLTIPHPRAHERLFVLDPWFELEPDARIPDVDGKPIALLREALKQ